MCFTSRVHSTEMHKNSLVKRPLKRIIDFDIYDSGSVVRTVFYMYKNPKSIEYRKIRLDLVILYNY